MISVESTKMCSCIRVTPSSELSIGPRTVFTRAKQLAYRKSPASRMLHFLHPRRPSHAENTCPLHPSGSADSGRRKRRDERRRTHVSDRATRKIEERFPLEHR